MTAEADAIRELNSALAELKQAQNDVARLSAGAAYNAENPAPREVIRVADAYVDLGRAAQRYATRARTVGDVLRAQRVGV